jgi:drug/metabolite transporter (DMT)-like permease
MSRRSLSQLVALALIWGASFLFIKLAGEGVSPTQLVLGRLLAAVVVLLAIVAVTRVPLPRGWVVWGHLALMGIVANIVPFFLFAWGEERVTSGMAGILNGTTPLFTLAVAVVASNEERLSRQRLTGFLLGFVGVVVVVGPWRPDSGINQLSGQLACLAAAACYGVAFVYTRRFLSQRGLAPLALSAGQLGVAALLLALTAPFTAADPMTLTPSVVGSILALGAGGTGLAYLLYYRIISDVGATTASLVTYLIPIVAVSLGVIVQDDPLTWNIFAGAVVVIAGAAIAEGRLATRPATEAPVMPVPQEGDDERAA